MALELRPLEDRIVIKPDDPAEMSKGGLHVPQSGRHIPQTGTVMWVGPGELNKFAYVKNGEWVREPMVINPGDRVFFPKNVGVVLQIDRDEFLVIRQSEIAAKIVKEGDEFRVV